MNPQSTVEYNSLSWVKKQLDTVLAEAQISLSDYIDQREQDHLTQCAENLKLVYGTLQMVEVYGAAMLAEEMLHTIVALQQGTVERIDDAFDVLMRAMLQLPDYLENIQNGATDTPIILMSLINDLRAARNDNLLSESVLFVADTDNIKLETDNFNHASIKAGKLEKEVKRLRTHFQLGLLDIIRNHKEKAGLQRISAVLSALEKVTHDDEIRHLWMVSSALVEGLMHAGIDNNISVKMLLAAVDRKLKQILDKGEEEFLSTYSTDLLKNMLYYVGSSKTDGKRIKAVKQAYKLKEFIPAEEDNKTPAMGGLNADLFETVSKGITEDLFKVKDLLEIFMQHDDQDIQQLPPVSEQLGRIADTFGMLSMGATRHKIVEQRDVIEKIIGGDETISEALVLGVAEELLNAESDLKQFISNRSGHIVEHEDADQIVPSAEYRQVVLAVVDEALKNFSVAKEALLSYVSGIGSTEKLDLIIEKLEEVRGVALMLPLSRIEKQIDQLKDYVSIALRDNKRHTESDEQDKVADVVTSIEYYLEALSEGRPGIDRAMESGDRAAQILLDIYSHYIDDVENQENQLAENHSVQNEQIDNIHDESQLTQTDEIIPDGSQSEDVAEDIIIPAKDDLQVTAVEAPTVKNNAIDKINTVPDYDQQYTILGDDADDEIVEIFIEEAVEVLEELHGSFPQWKTNPDDNEAVSTIRRGFHTLKGSGRLVGAELIGEFSWKFENALNCLIDKKISSTPALFNAVEEALSVLPQLIEQLNGNREPIQNINNLMAAVDALAEGIEPGVMNEAIIEDIQLADETTANADSEDTISAEEVEEICIDESITKPYEENILELIDANDVVVEMPTSMGENNTENIVIDDKDDSHNINNVIHINELKSSHDNKHNKNKAITDDTEGDECDVNDNKAEVTEDDNGNVFEEIDIDNSATNTSLDTDIEVIDDLSLEPDLESNETTRANSFEEIHFNESEILNENHNTENDDLYVIKIDEDGDIVSNETSLLNIDPVLLQIFYDEGISHLDNIHALIALHQSGEKQLFADKNFSRLFHTLYGSARAAEVSAIAEISSVAEKYIREKQNNEDTILSDDVVDLFVKTEQSLRNMLSFVKDSKIPETDKELLAQLNKLLQDEIQNQLQRAQLHHASSTEDIVVDEVIIDNEAILDDSILESTKDDNQQNNDVTADSATEINSTDDVNKAELSESEKKSTTDVSYGDIDDELIDIFIEEADELLEKSEQILQSIRDEADTAEYIHHLQRNMHTLKGGARMAEIIPVGDLTHILESLVVLMSEKKISITADLVDLIQESIDTLVGMIDSVRQRQPLNPTGSLIARIEKFMSGEVEEKRSLERYDINLSDLDELPEADQTLVYTEETLTEDVDLISNETHNNKTDNSEIEQKVEQTISEDTPSPAKPHWGERASDINFVESQDQVRVRTNLLNNLVNYAGEVNIYHARLGKQVADFGFNLSELSQTVVRLKEQLRKLEIETEIQIRSGYGKEIDEYDEGFDPLEMDRYSTLQQLTRSLMETAADVESINTILSDITRDSETLLLQESRVSTDLQEGLMRTRMVRFGGLSSRMRRIVRQIARELKKDVELKIVGENTEVDRTVLDRIIAPLEHMVRNAIAHGIESPEERLANDKTETGTISIAVGRQGTNIVISVKDDGRGINLEKVCNTAIAQGLLDSTETVSNHDILQLILHSGFSTADEVTQVSGRGVGMDVVDSEIKQLGGILEIDTVAGRGTEFNIRLPLTLAINQALLITTGDDIYAVPLTSIEGVVRITGMELQRFYDDDAEDSCYVFNGVEYELKHLGAMLTGIQPDYSKQLRLFPVLLVNVGEQHFAIHVDDLIGRREIVVKPVGLQIGGVRGIAGATILADGRVVLILEMATLILAGGLFKSECTDQVVASGHSEKRLSILVVDDSITIRKVTERILGRNGFDVILAKDGVDATSKMQDHIPDLMLLDIEMPRMDGFEVAAYVRNNERLKTLPIIMITSRSGAKHKEKAMEIGVNEYLGKPYQEEELMKNIHSLLDTAS